ncbi:uncharacterized protein [Palaemon carinicauda]|uniref:uncharacterized protein n=1 Tax=Palaemon carinicauda TaxID=392227 RepID=UPI0035B5CA57
MELSLKDQFERCARELRVKGWPERVCDGVVDCEDMSDEAHCSHCPLKGFRCGSGGSCVAQERRCDGIEDCPNGADERGCLSLTPTPTEPEALTEQQWIVYNREGLLRYTEGGQPARVCVDNINKTLTTQDAHQLIHNMAEVTCDPPLLRKTVGVGVPCVRSSSMTDSELFSRGRGCSRRWCVCLILAVLFVSLGAAAGIYFAYQFLGLELPHEHVFRGMFQVESGDKWSPALSDPTSVTYSATAKQYAARLDNVYKNSVFKNVFIRAEVLSLDKGVDNDLIVYFNLHINYRRLHLDAADLYLVLVAEIRRPDSRALAGIKIYEDSVEIQGRDFFPSGLAISISLYTGTALVSSAC